MSHSRVSEGGLLLALLRVRDPLLLLLLPASVALFVFIIDYRLVGQVAFDFRGTLWEPARAILEGGRIYPRPILIEVDVGNPAVYPPLFMFLSIPLGLVPVAVSAWIWVLILGLGVVAALRTLGVRDWRCYALALTSPAVVQGMFWGNLTLLLLVPLALAWRYRERAQVSGLALAFGIAAKLFLWPVLFWLLVTRRYRAASTCAIGASLLVLVPWTFLGFEGLLDYPALLRVAEEVYAGNSYSLATVASGLEVPESLGVGICALAAVVLLGGAWRVSRGRDGDQRAFALAVAAAILGSPIVWHAYLALLLVPLAVAWPRFSPAWLLPQSLLLVGLLPRPMVPDPPACCRPPDVPTIAWVFVHMPPHTWLAVGSVAVVLAVTWGSIHRRSPTAVVESEAHASGTPR